MASGGFGKLKIRGSYLYKELYIHYRLHTVFEFFLVAPSIEILPVHQSYIYVVLQYLCPALYQQLVDPPPFPFPPTLYTGAA